MLVFEEENTKEEIIEKKTLRARTRTNNQLNPHKMMSVHSTSVGGKKGSRQSKQPVNGDRWIFTLLKSGNVLKRF